MNHISDEELGDRMRQIASAGGPFAPTLIEAADRLSALSPRVVTDEMAREFDKAYRKASNGIAWFQVGSNHTEAVRAALTAALTAALSSAGEKEETRQARVEHFETPTLAEVIEKARRGEIEDNPPSSGREPQTIEDYITSPHPTSADKLEVVGWRMDDVIMPQNSSATLDAGWASYRAKHPNSWVVTPLVRQSDATRIITEQAERVAGLERERDEAMDWASNWHGQCQAVATILGLPEPEGIGHAEAVRDKFKAAEADRDRMKEALGKLVQLYEQDCDPDVTKRPDWLDAALDGGAEK